MTDYLLQDESALAWLLEPADPGARYLALRDLARLDADDADLRAARRLAHTQGPIAQVLANMQEGGYWSKPGPGYNPKYFSTVWSLILLAQLGASLEEDARIASACEHILRHALTPGGQFSVNGAPSGTIDCLQGNLCWALLELGVEPERLAGAYAWMARTVTGEGIAPRTDQEATVRYYAYKSGPLFACGVNDQLACAWGAVKVMMAFSRLPRAAWTGEIERAVEQGAGFLFSVDPALARYPSARVDRPSPNWWKFGFPVFYITDLLQLVEALVRLGYGGDPRLEHATAVIRQKQDDQGRWALEYHYSGKIYAELGEKRAPNKWVTLRALRTLSL